jgi:predicted protein tyrosine phosphatase
MSKYGACLADVSHIYKKIFISSAKQAESCSQLQQHDITNIVSIRHTTLGEAPYKTYNNFVYFQIDDVNDDDDLENAKHYATYWDAACEFVKHSSGNVVFHCQAGISRSPTLAVYCLVNIYNMKLDDAFKMVEKKRPIVSINDAFVSILKTVCQ